MTSEDIRDADGTTGQNTATGSGVKTGHIQDEAVTNAKLANGAVTDGKISGTISGAKLGVHGHAQADVVGLDAALAGKAPAVHGHSVDDVSGLAAALAAKAAVSHSHDEVYQRKYAGTLIVAKQGGDFASVKAAVDATWTLASAAQPYLVKVMPGVFDETGLIQVPAYVDVEGSGVSVTTVRSHTSGLLLRGSGIEIRHLTVEVQGNETTGACPRSSASGISLMDGQTARLTNMAVRAVDSNYSVAVDQQNSYLQLRNVDVYASAITVPGCTSYAKAVHVIGGEVDVQGGSVEAYGGTGSGSIAPNGAVWLAGGGRATLVGTNVFGEHAALELGPYNTPPTDVNVVTLFAARVQGGVYALDTSWTASIAKASGTQFTGPIHFGGTLKLRNCMDANFDPL